MRQAIETAPLDGKYVILEDDNSGTYDVARWSQDALAWVGEYGTPTKISPTHWHRLPQTAPQDALELSSAGQAPPKKRRIGFFRDRTARSTATAIALEDPPGIPERHANLVENSGPAIAINKERRPRTRRRLAVAAVGAGLVAAVLLSLTFRDELSAFTRPKLELAEIDAVRIAFERVPKYLAELSDRSSAHHQALPLWFFSSPLESFSPLESTENIILADPIAKKTSEPLASLAERWFAAAERPFASLAQRWSAVAERWLAKDTTDSGLMKLETKQTEQETTGLRTDSHHLLQQVRSRANLAGELSIVRAELEKTMARLTKAENERKKIREASDAQTALLQHLLQQERRRVATLTRELELASAAGSRRTTHLPQGESTRPSAVRLPRPRPITLNANKPVPTPRGKPRFSGTKTKAALRRKSVEAE